MRGICASCHRLCDSEENAPTPRNQRCPKHLGIEPPVQFQRYERARQSLPGIITVGPSCVGQREVRHRVLKTRLAFLLSKTAKAT